MSVYFVTYSPRGFANEIAVAAFATKAEADDFRSGVDNDVNKWTAATNSNLHQRTVRAFKRDMARYGYADPVAYYQAEVEGLF